MASSGAPGGRPSYSRQPSGTADPITPAFRRHHRPKDESHRLLWPTVIFLFWPGLTNPATAAPTRRCSRPVMAFKRRHRHCCCKLAAPHLWRLAARSGGELGFARWPEPRPHGPTGDCSTGLLATLCVAGDRTAGVGKRQGGWPIWTRRPSSGADRRTETNSSRLDQRPRNGQPVPIRT